MSDALTEEQLDALLNELFVRSDAAAGGESAARFMLDQTYDVTMPPAREREMLNRLATKNKGGKGWKTTLWLLLPVLAVSAWLLLKNKTPETIIQQQTEIKNPVKIANNKQHTNETYVNENKNPDLPANKEDQKPLLFQPFGNNIMPVIPVSGIPAPPAPAPLPEKESYSSYLSLKAMVLEKIRGINESLYTRVEEGRVKYKSQNMPVDAFVIRNFAITNSEYKIFLADLIRTGRTVDYKTATPQTDTWNDFACPQLAAAYFADTRYDDFPVVTISYAAAQMYCTWLEDQLNETVNAQSSKTKKLRKLHVRLPADYEWIHAARVGYADIPDCYGYNTIYDPKDSLVDQTFIKRMAQVKKADHRTKTTMDKLFSLNRYGMTETEILGIFESGINNAPNSAGGGYPGNMAGCGKAGHVSEMIHDASGKMIVMGSCWKTKNDYLQVVDDFRKKESSPLIGFRIVITHADKSSYKNPFW